MRKPGINLTVGVLLLIVSFGISAPALWGATQLIKADEVEQVNGGGGGGTPGASAEVTIVSQNLRFDPTTVTVPAGVEVTITHDNRDAGVLHNVAVYTNQTAQSSIFVGELTTGPSVDDYVFNSPETPGSYFFRCDVHPDTMTGAFIVE